MNHSNVVAYLILLGIAEIAIGIWIRLGKNRAGYLVPNYYVLLPKNGRYALPFGGLMMIMIGISLLMPNPATARLFSIFGVFPLVVIIFAIIVWAPKWLKPEWEQWLEATHGDILELVIREARQTRGWASMVSTQEGLEDWVTRTRRKYRAFATPRPDNYHLGDRVLWFSTSNHIVWPVQATVVIITE